VARFPPFLFIQTELLCQKGVVRDIPPGVRRLRAGAVKRR